MCVFFAISSTELNKSYGHKCSKRFRRSRLLPKNSGREIVFENCLASLRCAIPEKNTFVTY